MSSLFSIIAIGCSIAAVLLLWTAWRRRANQRGPFVASLVAWGLALASWVKAFGMEVGIPLALESAAIVAFVFILSRIEFRDPRSGRERYTPPTKQPPYRWLRGTMRGVGAGPIGFAASAGIGVLFATTAPLDDATRLILAGLLIPSLWGAAMIWVFASRCLLLPSAGLLGIAIATIGTSILVAR